MQPIMELVEVSKVYDSAARLPALSRVSVSASEGEVLAVMGPSGSGKSTLLNLVAGLDRATSGQVLVDGVDLGRLGEASLARFRRTRVGVIFQFFNLLNNLTALDNVLIPAQLGGSRGGSARARSLELLDRLGVADLQARYPARLSGGERQRVAIARALVNRPRLLLADEPTGALDSRNGEEVFEILADLNRTGQTIVIVTHDARLAERWATRMVRLVDGAIAAGSTELVMAR
jgi:putative ABC transport system ATP-binding protein